MARAAFAVAEVRPASIRALNFSPEIDAFRSGRGRRQSVPLSSLVAELGPSYLNIFTRYDCDPSLGEELLTQADTFAAEPMGRFIRGDALRHLEAHRIKPWQILIAGTGQAGENDLFGRCVVVDDRLAGRIVGPDTLAITFKDAGSAESLCAYAFLCTTAGLRSVRATRYGSSIPRIRTDLLASLPIPLPEPEQVERVAGRIRVTVEARAKYLTEIRAARELVEDLPAMRHAASLCRERRARCLIWKGPLRTLNAWNYGSAGEALAFLLDTWKTRLGDVVEPEGIFNGPRFARIPCRAPYGVDFLSQRDVFMMRPIPRRVLRPNVSNRLLFAPRESLLLGGHGQMSEGSLFGRVMMVRGVLESSVVTEDSLRVVPAPNESPLCLAFLSTRIGYRLVCSAAYGTSIPKMRPDLLRALPFPDVDSAFRRRVAGHVEAAMHARTVASEAEAEAFRIVEDEVLPAWLS